MQKRPLIYATRGLITSGHYLASAAGHRVALMGGNAIDVAATVCFTLNLLENQNCGIGGEVPTLIYSARDKKTYEVSGLGWNASAFTIDWCRAHHLDMIPGDGYLPAVVPAVVGTWGAALERFGRLSFAQVLQPVIELAENGYPVYEDLHRVLVHQQDKFTLRYPTTGKIFLPGGSIPEIGTRLANPDLANTLKIMVKAEAGQAYRGRSAGIQAAVKAFYQGPIAEQIVRFIQDHPVEDSSGAIHAGLLSYEDLATWEARIEEPLSFVYEGLTVNKCSSWTQGPVFLQQLALLAGFDLKGMGLNSVEYIHTLLESIKLAYADREAYYGDPLFDSPPFDVLLSEAYNAQRRDLIEPLASLTLHPGDAGQGVPRWDISDVVASNREGVSRPQTPVDEAGHHGDTTHLDVVDGEGNLVAATPSGGWIPSSPVIEGLGFPLGTRGQMFYLNPARPNALAPHKRPRATLTPTLVTRDGKPLLAFGMRGGDRQDQKTLQFFLAHVLFNLDIQSALDVPAFHSEAFPSSFTPRGMSPGLVVLEEGIDPAVARGLEHRGHKVLIDQDVRENRMAIRVDADNGVMSGGVCSSGEHAYALGWS